MPAEISERRATGLAKGTGFEGDPLAQQETHQLVRSYYRIANPYLRDPLGSLVGRFVDAIAVPDAGRSAVELGRVRQRARLFSTILEALDRA